MPTYDYKCKSCGYTFEHFQSMTEQQLTECPLCKGELKRLIGAGLGPIFKGSGFYETDYKHKPAAKSSTNTKQFLAKHYKKSRLNKPAFLLILKIQSE